MILSKTTNKELHDDILKDWEARNLLLNPERGLMKRHSVKFKLKNETGVVVDLNR